MLDCDAILTSKGLLLRKNPDGKGYAVVGIGECRERTVSVGVCEDGLPVTVVENEAFQSCGAERIILGESVHTVGVKAFWYCANLKSIKMLGVERIEWLAFDNCRVLTEVDFGARLSFIDERAFEGCRSLSSLRLPASIAEIGASAFSDSPLTSVTVDRADGEGYDYSLGNERELASLLSDRNAPLVRREYGRVRELPCDAVINTPGLSLRLDPDGESYTVTGPGHMDFHTRELCIGYHEDGRPVRVIAKEAFENVERAGIDTVRIGGTVEIIEEGAFCRASFKHLVLSEGLYEIGDYAFYSGEFDTLTIPRSVKKIGASAFCQCRSVTGELILPEGLTRIEEKSFSHLFGITGTLVIPKGVTYIGSCAFSFDLRLEGIVLEDPEGWEERGEPVDLSDPKKNAELLSDMCAREISKRA